MAMRFACYLAALACMLGAAMMRAAELRAFPDPADLPAHPDLPDPLRFFDGTPVTSRKVWWDRRRPELQALFQHYMYGYLPPPPKRVTGSVRREVKSYFGGKASLREVTLSYGIPGAPEIHLLLVWPRQPRKVPVFVGMNFCGNHALLQDPEIRLSPNWMYDSCPGCRNGRATEQSRGGQVDVWALEQAIDRGYAVATFHNGDIDPDQPSFDDGIHRFFYKPGQTAPGPTEWGAIAAWSWGIHRAVDYLHQLRFIDTSGIAVVGHSRLGKTALLAAALDDRIDLVVANQAGCGGTAPSRGKVGESVKQINDRFPHWFNDIFPKFNQATERLPFDQHSLVAIVAPRPVLFTNAEEDQWANPAGQFEVLRAADPVYRFLGAEGLGVDQMPPLNRLVGGRLGYYIRPGKHAMTREDWKIYLDFADRHLRKEKR